MIDLFQLKLFRSGANIDFCLLLICLSYIIQLISCEYSHWNTFHIWDGKSLLMNCSISSICFLRYLFKHQLLCFLVRQIKFEKNKRQSLNRPTIDRNNQLDLRSKNTFLSSMLVSRDRSELTDKLTEQNREGYKFIREIINVSFSTLI